MKLEMDSTGKTEMTSGIRNSYISLYSNIGITDNSGIESEIYSKATSKGYIEVQNLNDLKSNYEIISAFFLIKFDNGVILSDKYDFETPLAINTKGNTKAISFNTFTDLMFTVEESSDSCFKIEWSSSDSDISVTVYDPNGTDIYYQFNLNEPTYNNINYNYNAKAIDHRCIGMRFFFIPKAEVDDSSIESNNFFSFSSPPNFLRVQTDHSLIHFILFKYTKYNNQLCQMVELESGGMRQYTYGYKIKKWILYPFTTYEREITPDSNLVRIFSNRDKISILFGKDNVSDDDLSDDDFTLRCVRYKEDNNYKWKWFANIDEGCTLDGIWNKFDDSITVITEGDLYRLEENQFMYGNGIVEFNDGYVYGNGKVINNYGKVYGNGNVENNSGYVYGNGEVTTNSGDVPGNSKVPTNSGYVYGNGNVTTNSGYVPGNGNVLTNKLGVYGNGDVEINDGLVYGNGRVGGYDNPNLDNVNYYGNGKKWNVNYRTINGGIIETGNTYQEIDGNEITGGSNNINCSVIYDDSNTVKCNTINGNGNVINGFRVYGSGNKIEGNKINGNSNVINPNYVTGTSVECENTEITGNYNIINDPNAVVLKGTMNIFN